MVLVDCMEGLAVMKALRRLAFFFFLVFCIAQLYDIRFVSFSFSFDQISYNSAKTSQRYAIEISKTRIDRLFRVLKSHEERHAELLDALHVLKFTDLVEVAAEKSGTGSELIRREIERKFGHLFEQIRTNLRLSQKDVVISEDFVRNLKNKTDFYSFIRPRQAKLPAVSSEDDNSGGQKPVILCAANHKYFNPLIQMVKNIHEKFPNHKLIVYDIGLTVKMLKYLASMCKCEIREFNFSYYQHLGPHITNLNTYAWKPILIQETLREYRKVIYVDSSIRFNTNQIQPVMDACGDLGVMARYITTPLLCFTHPDMFEWFQEDPADFKFYLSAEANFIIFDGDNLLTALVMKAWVTCTLSGECIAPRGSHIYGGIKNWLFGCEVCGCHRFDQDAFTIALSFFYGQPVDPFFDPPYVFTKNELELYSIHRRDPKTYIVDQLQPVT